MADKNDKLILAIAREVLLGDKKFQGFLPVNEADFLNAIRNNINFMRRGDVEENPAIQQPIPYVWIVNPETKQIFVYQRSSAGQNYGEKRLSGNLSCGVGGHIEKSDAADPVVDAMMRELKEEVRIAEYPIPKIIGYIKDDSTPVNSVHFGIVAVAETTLPVSKGDDEMQNNCRFVSASELEQLFSDADVKFDDWTRISWAAVKDYLGRI